MNEFEFASRHLQSWTVKGNEIVPTLCPYCNGGTHHDKYTFALNTENHTFNCKRGSCGKQGHFSQLLKDFGEESERDFAPPRVRRLYKRPEPPRIDEKGLAMEYVRLRGIVDYTASLYGVGGNDKGEVVFPYYETAEDFKRNAPTFIKYRPAHKLAKGEAKARREKDTKPILFGMHLCTPGETLYIFEGEFDAMAGYQAHGGNCVSVPSGCSDFTWLETCEEWLSQYNTIAVIGDNDEPGHMMIKRLTDKLSCKILVPDFHMYEGCKDANEICFRHGKDRLREIMDSAKPMPVNGILNIAEVKRTDPADLPRIMSGIKRLDRVTGGFYDGDLNIWTGKRGEGKSTVLDQISLDSVDQGRNVCVYSGEIPANRFKSSLYVQAAGTKNLNEYLDRIIDKVNYVVPAEKAELIDRWLNGRYWLYDNTQVGANETENILRIFEQAYKRCDCTVFIVDNLMTIQTDSPDYYREQFVFARKLKEFANRFQVQVHLVVHPRKTGDRAVIDNDDVGGSGNLTNIACAVFSLQRLDEDNARKYNCDSVLNVIKNRMNGTLQAIKLDFSPYCKRFIEPGEPEKAYGWEKIGTNVNADDEPPF